jgi:hypothetical protein
LILVSVTDHPHSGWLGFYHRREKAGVRSAPVVAGEPECEAPGLENPIIPALQTDSQPDCRKKEMKFEMNDCSVK